MDDRSERLRKRRKRSADPRRRTEASEDEEEADRETPDPERDSIKDKQVGTYMYLPKSQTKELRRLYNVLKAEYEFEYDTEFEKNRHFYPLVIQYGLEDLEGLDASEIRARLDDRE